MIRVTAPLAGVTITSPVTVIGKARGSWFFEASFPIVVVDWDGKIIGEGHAQAESSWMTTDFVPFTATISFTPDTTVSTRGALILRKDNPSGLFTNDAALEIPIVFQKNSNVQTGTVQGNVTLGPTCPVQRIPPDPKCADRPYQTTVQVIQNMSPRNSPFATMATDVNGSFSFKLPPGSYNIQAVGGTTLPRCNWQDVTVVANTTQSVNLSCDTGIR